MKNTKPEFPESVKKKIVAIMKTCFETPSLMHRKYAA